MEPHLYAIRGRGHLPPDPSELTHPALTPAGQTSTRFSTPEGWKAELTQLTLIRWLHTEMVYLSTDGHPSK